MRQASNVSAFDDEMRNFILSSIFRLALGIGKICDICFSVYQDSEREHKLLCKAKFDTLNTTEEHLVLGVNVYPH